MPRLSLCSLLIVLSLAGGVSCRQEATTSKEKTNRAERDAQALKERETIASFARQIDALLDWRASGDSPVEPGAAATAIAARLQALPSEGLPADLTGALSESRTAWSALAQALAKHAPDSNEVLPLVEKADMADHRLNQALAARGFPDVAL